MNKESLKILAIGNSFSDDAMQYLYYVATAFGIKNVIVANLYIGGCSIARHYDNMLNNNPEYLYRKNTTGEFKEFPNTKMVDGILDEEWDIITLQQASGVSGMIDTYNEQINSLISYVNKYKRNPNCKIAWHMTWSYQADSLHEEFINYHCNQEEMYLAITNCVIGKIVPNKSFTYIIPALTSIQNARHLLGDKLTRDGYHLNELGRYIVSVTWMLVFGYKWDAFDLTMVLSDFIPYIDIIREAVDKTIKSPFKAIC